MSLSRGQSLRIFVALVALVIAGRLFYLQVIDTRYKVYAKNNALRPIVQNPPRGEIYDRNGLFLAQSREAYDLMVIPRDVGPFDTLEMCRIIGVEKEELIEQLRKARAYAYRKPSVLFKLLDKEVKMKFEEHNFPGFYTQYRTVRSYPFHTAGNILGYVGEVGDNTIRNNSYYKRGDYIGMTGIESAYEEILRGRKGVRMELVDVHGMPKGSYAEGRFDTLAVPGVSITSTIDAKLQLLGEELMRGKVGSIVAIEPATGEILMMVSSPTYNPDELIGRDRSRNYMKLLRDPRRPLYNRAVMASYPPGSTFKLSTGLIGLQEGVLVPSQQYVCNMGYPVGRGVKCHSHASPLDMYFSIQTSCNAYYCYVFRNILDNKVYGDVRKGMEVWRDYLLSMGFGRRLDSDFSGELKGNIPTPEFYDRIYNGRWNSLTAISLSIGQGEVGVTPLQLANFTATIANRGYYKIPHIIKSIEGRQIDPIFNEPHYTKVDSEHYKAVAEGMYRAVNVAGTAVGAAVPGLDICGKTGTAQNGRGRDHSTFASFAPYNDPKIAVSVYVEHGGFGATVAMPIASLVIEQYLTDTITRPWLVEHVKQMNIPYPQYDKR